MKIAGLQKTSLIDYPGKVSAIIFTQGCPFRCGYCYNPGLLPLNSDDLFNTEEVLKFLERRSDVLDALVITGGEPTLQKDLPQFIKKVKDLNYLVKLDSNGTNPEMLKYLIKEKLIDYFAMDIKAPVKKYRQVVNVDIDPKIIKKSIRVIKNSDVDYEFRSTVLPALHSETDIIDMAKSIKGAKKYYLQKFLPSGGKLQDPSLAGERPFDDEKIKELAGKCKKFVENCQVR